MEDNGTSDANVVSDGVCEELQRDILAADFLTSLFWSALSSYRHDTLLRPFPPAYAGEEGQKDIERLRAAFKQLPPLDQVLAAPGRAATPPLHLLHWVLTASRTFSLHYCPSSTLDTIFRRAQAATPIEPPRFVFELKYSPKAEERFHETAAPHGGFFYAFHGSQMENFYSIIHNGLLSHMNKTAAFGEGTYLSTDISVCRNWSPFGSLWPKSLLPHTASCVAVCEVVKHPDVQSRAQIGGEPSLGQKVPDRYFIVANNELVRIKYILVYGKQRTSSPRHWLSRHPMLTLLSLYFIFLLLLGVVKSKQFQLLYSKYAPWS